MEARAAAYHRSESLSHVLAWADVALRSHRAAAGGHPVRHRDRPRGIGSRRRRGSSGHARAGLGGRQELPELSHPRPRGHRVRLRDESVQPALHRRGGVRQQLTHILGQRDQLDGHRQGPVQHQPDRPPVSGQHLLRVRALGGPQLLGVGWLHARRQLPLGDLRRDHAALHQRLHHHDHRRQLRGRVAVPHGEPAARGGRRRERPGSGASWARP